MIFKHKPSISYSWGEEYLLINLGRRLQPRIKILLWAELFAIVGFATVLVFQSFNTPQTFLSIFLLTGSVVLYLSAAYRFLSRIYAIEKLLLDDSGLSIIFRTPFSQKVNKYEWRHMGPLHYVGKPTKTDHPLKGGCYDYFGFETQEKLLQNLYQEGNMYFNYGGYPVRFAKGVYSWYAEEIVNMMKLYTGQDLELGPEWGQMIQEYEMGDS